MDTAPEWEKWDWIGDKFGFSLPSLKRALMNILYRSFMHTYFWINDPDCLMIRRTDTDLTLDEIKLQLTLFGLSGGQILISDDMTKLSEEELSDAKLVFPPYTPKLYDPILTDAFTSEYPTIYFLETFENIGKRYLTAIINWEDDPITRTLNISELFPNLPEDEKEFYIFDFWNKEFLGIYNSESTIETTIPPHFCSYYSIIYVNKDLKEKPLLLSSDLHITQGCCEVTEFEYDEEENEISVIIDLIGEREGTLYLKLPMGKYITDCAYDYSIKNKKENIWAISVSFINSCSFKIDLNE
jgi:alpha-galactosidase